MGMRAYAVLLHFAIQPGDLPLVHQQSARTAGILIKDVALFIRGDVHLVDEQLAVFDATPGILRFSVPARMV